jgi:hypothetical protein
LKHDVTGVHYKVVDQNSSCSDPAIAETTSPLEDEELPAGVLPPGAGSHANGGLDTVVALNDPPKIDNLAISPSKFITQCETATITVTASDPDGDQLT